MPTDQYGTLEILNRTIEIVSLLLLTQYGITYIRFFRDKPDEDYRKRVTSTSMYVVVAIALLVATAMALLRVPLSQLLFNSPDFGLYIVLVAIRYVLDMGFVVPFLYYQATEQPKKYIIISTTRFATTLLLNIAFLTMMDDKVAAVLWAQIVSVAVFALTIGVWVFWKSARVLDRHLTGQILKFTWSFSFLGLYSFVIASGDRFVLNEYCGKSEVGVYSAGYRIAQVLSVLIFSPILRAGARAWSNNCAAPMVPPNWRGSQPIRCSSTAPPDWRSASMRASWCGFSSAPTIKPATQSYRSSSSDICSRDSQVSSMAESTTPRRPT